MIWIISGVVVFLSICMAPFSPLLASLLSLVGMGIAFSKLFTTSGGYGYGNTTVNHYHNEEFHEHTKNEYIMPKNITEATEHRIERSDGTAIQTRKIVKWN